MLVRTSNRPRTLVTLLWAAYGEYQRDYARYFASAMVYYSLISLVPVLLLLLATLGLALRFTDLAATAAQDILQRVESGLGEPVRATLEQLLEQLKQESIVATVVSLAGMLLTASALFRHLRASFRAIWKHAPPLFSGSLSSLVGTTFRDHLISLALVLVGAALLLGAVTTLAAIQWLSGLFGDAGALQTAGWLLALPLPFLMAALTFGILFKFLPPVRMPWRDVWLAAALCGLAWTITAEVLALYASFAGANRSTSGTVGAILVLMLWVNGVSQVLFYGAELCKVVWTRRTAAEG
jgi:membrane protein